MERFKIKNIPAVVYGGASDKVYIYIHGRFGSKEEGEDLAALVCPLGYQVLSVDLPEHGERSCETGTFNPWNAVPELKLVLAEARRRWAHISVRANSIGAWFALLSFAGEELGRCLFVSPILDMEKMILNMMAQAGVTEGRLRDESIIRTDFGETLSREYLSFVRGHGITRWDAPTYILYGSKDDLTDRPTLEAFAKRFSCSLTVMEGGEHWFHTPGQMEALRRWTIDSIRG